MVQLKDELWKHQYNNTVIVGRYGVAPPSSVMISEVDEDFTSGYTINSGIFNPAGSGNYTISSYRKHVDAQRVENLMCWFDELAVAHKFSTSPYNLENLTVGPGGFNWTIHNGIERVSFTPQYDASGLFGYSWADNNLWKQIRGAISFVCDNLNVVPPHDLTDYSGEYRFASIESTHNPGGGVWPSRWGGQVVSSDPYEVTLPSGFGGPGATGVYYEHRTLGLWLPPTDETDWSKSIPSGINSAEGGVFGFGSDDFESLAKNNYGQIGQYGALSTNEYKQYFPTTGQSNLDGLFVGVGLIKYGSVGEGPHKQYIRVTPEGDIRSFMSYLQWYRNSAGHSGVGTYTYNPKYIINHGGTGQGLTTGDVGGYVWFDYTQPIIYSYKNWIDTPAIYETGYFKEPDVWTWGGQDREVYNVGYGSYAERYPYFFAFLFEAQQDGVNGYFKDKNFPKYGPYFGTTNGNNYPNGLPPGVVYAYTAGGFSYYYNSNFIDKYCHNYLYNVTADGLTFVSEDIGSFINPDENYWVIPSVSFYGSETQFYRSFDTAFNYGYPSLSGLPELYQNGVSINNNVGNAVGYDSTHQFTFPYPIGYEVGEKLYKAVYHNHASPTQAHTGNYGVSSTGWGMDSPNSWVYSTFNIPIHTTKPLSIVQAWQDKYDELTADKAPGEVARFNETQPYEQHQIRTSTIYNNLSARWDLYAYGKYAKTYACSWRVKEVHGNLNLTSNDRLMVNPNNYYYKLQELVDAQTGYDHTQYFKCPAYEEVGAIFADHLSRYDVRENWRPSARDEWKLMDDIPASMGSDLTAKAQTAYASGKWGVYSGHIDGYIYDVPVGVVDNYHKWGSTWGGNLVTNDTNPNIALGFGSYFGSLSGVTGGVSTQYYAEVSSNYTFKQHAQLFYTYVDSGSLRNKFGLVTDASGGLKLKGSVVFGLGLNVDSYGGVPVQYEGERFLPDGNRNWSKGVYTPETPKTFKIVKGWFDYGSGTVDYDHIMNNLSTGQVIYSTTGQGFIVDTSGNITPPTITDFEIDFNEIADEHPPFDNACFYMVYHMDPVDLVLPQANFYWNQPLDERRFTYDEQAKGGRAAIYSNVSHNVAVSSGIGGVGGIIYSQHSTYFPVKNETTVILTASSTYNHHIYNYGYGSPTNTRAWCTVFNLDTYFNYNGKVFNSYNPYGGYRGYVYNGRPLSIGHDNQLHQF